VFSFVVRERPRVLVLALGRTTTSLFVCSRTPNELYLAVFIEKRPFDLSSLYSPKMPVDVSLHEVADRDLSHRSSRDSCRNQRLVKR
jgi:hypothetical protein